MELDMKKVMILLQRKYNSVRELDRLTKELEEVAVRNDGISAAMVLEMRGEEMEKTEQCIEELRQMGEENREVYEKLKILLESDPAKAIGETKEEEMIYEIRRKTQDVLDRLRRRDQRLNERVTGQKSFYKSYKEKSEL